MAYGLDRLIPICDKVVKIRLGNDIPLVWRFFTRSGDEKIPYIIEGKNVRIELTDPVGGVTVVDAELHENAASWYFRGKDQRLAGDYTLTFIENPGEDEMKTLDKIKPFRLVREQETVQSGTIQGCCSSLEVQPVQLESIAREVVSYNDLTDKPSINGVTLEGDKTSDELGIEPKHYYRSLERLRRYLYRVTFDALPEDNGSEGPVLGGCSSYVKDGRLHTNYDWNYDNTASFIIRTRDFEGQSMVEGLNDGALNEDLIAQLPYRVHRSVNNHGISVATHVLYNDWQWTGCGEKNISITRLAFLVLSRVRSMATIAEDLNGVLDNLYCPEGLAELEYLLQFIVTDGTTTYVIIPPTSANQSYELVNATTNPKMSNFRWVNRATVARTDNDIQRRPTGIERYNAMPCPLEELRFTKAYETPARLSEFIGLRGTTKDSTDAELLAIYEDARALYLDRQRDGQTWQTVESSVYGERLNSLYIQENWTDEIITTALIEAETERAEAAEAALNAKIEAETERAEQTETELDAKIEAETERAEQAEGELAQSIAQETERAEAAEQELDNKIDAETARAEAAETTLDGKIDTEQQRAEGAEEVLDGKIDETAAELTQEAQRATARENEIEAAIPAVIDNVTSTVTDDALSAKQGKLLNDRINNLASRGRFLSLWDCTTGLPLTNPSGYPYEYKTGDFFIVSKVGETNYIPNGDTYTGQPSTTVYADAIKPNDTIFYDGTQWMVADAPEGGKVQDVYVNGTSVLSGSVAYVLVPTTLADLQADATHRLVTDVQVAAWNAKVGEAPEDGKQYVRKDGAWAEMVERELMTVEELRAILNE